MMEKVKKFLRSLRPFMKPFLVVFLIYCFAMLAIWRSGVSFVDDKGRAFYGYAWTSDFNRYSSTAFGLFLNMNDRLLDISPWPQILAMAILSVVSVVVTYTFCDKKIRYLPLILSVLIGLQPLTLECWLYKFDAPCIALAALVSVLPILWWPKDFSKKSVLRFVIITMVCMLVMWTSYQAASGIFPVLCVYAGLKDVLRDKKLKPVVLKLLIAVAAFIVPVVIFKFCLPEPDKSYRTNEMLSFSELAPGVWRNLVAHLELFWSGFNIWQKILAVLAAVGTGALILRKYRVKSLLILVAFIIAVLLTFGAFLLLVKPPLTPRSLVGVGMLFVPVLILATKDLTKVWEYVAATPSLILLYTFMMFALAMGNGLADQERYANYRIEELLSDLAEIYPSHEEVKSAKIQIRGDIGYSAVMRHVVDKYPAAGKLVTFQQTGLSQGAWGITKLRSYYNRLQEFQIIEENPTGCDGLPIVKETYYYEIKDAKAGLVCVDLK